MKNVLLIIIIIILICICLYFIFKPKNRLYRGGLTNALVIDNEIGACVTVATIKSLLNSDKACKEYLKISFKDGHEPLRSDTEDSKEESQKINERVSKEWIQNPLGLNSENLLKYDDTRGYEVIEKLPIKNVKKIRIKDTGEEVIVKFKKMSNAEAYDYIIKKDIISDVSLQTKTEIDINEFMGHRTLDDNYFILNSFFDDVPIPEIQNDDIEELEYGNSRPSTPDPFDDLQVSMTDPFGKSRPSTPDPFDRDTLGMPSNGDTLGISSSGDTLGISSNGDTLGISSSGNTLNKDEVLKISEPIIEASKERINKYLGQSVINITSLDIKYILTEYGFVQRVSNYTTDILKERLEYNMNILYERLIEVIKCEMKMNTEPNKITRNINGRFLRYLKTMSLDEIPDKEWVVDEVYIFFCNLLLDNDTLKSIYDKGHTDVRLSNKVFGVANKYTLVKYISNILKDKFKEKLSSHTNIYELCCNEKIELKQKNELAIYVASNGKDFELQYFNALGIHSLDSFLSSMPNIPDDNHYVIYRSRYNKDINMELYYNLYKYDIENDKELELYGNTYDINRDHYIKLRRFIEEKYPVFDNNGFNVAGLPIDSDLFNKLLNRYDITGYDSTDMVSLDLQYRYIPKERAKYTRGKIYDTDIVYVFPRNMSRFGYDTGYVQWDGRRVIHVLIGRIIEYGMAYPSSYESHIKEVSRYRNSYMDIMTTLVGFVHNLCNDPEANGDYKNTDIAIRSIITDKKIKGVLVSSVLDYYMKRVTLDYVQIKSPLENEDFPSFSSEDVYVMLPLLSSRKYFNRIINESDYLIGYYRKLISTVVKDTEHSNTYWIPTDCVCSGCNKKQEGCHAVYYDLLAGIYSSNYIRTVIPINKFFKFDYITDEDYTNVLATFDPTLYYPRYVHFQKFVITDASLLKDYTIISNEAHTSNVLHIKNHEELLKELLKKQNEMEPKNSILKKRYKKNYEQTISHPQPYAMEINRDELLQIPKRNMSE